MKQLIQSFNSTVVSGTVVQSVTETAAKNTVNGETFDALYIKTIRLTQQLRNAGYHVIEKWSCEFSDEDCRCAHEFGIESKVPQLVPKDAFLGGRTEAGCFPWLFSPQQTLAL